MLKLLRRLFRREGDILIMQEPLESGEEYLSPEYIMKGSDIPVRVAAFNNSYEKRIVRMYESASDGSLIVTVRKG